MAAPHPTPQEETVTKILTPPQPAPIMEIARDLLPPGMELIVADPGKPEFYDAAGDAEYYLGSPRQGIGNEFFRAAPKLKLVQLTSAGYDRVDIEAARKARVPVANNGGANSVAVAEHAVMLMLAVLKKLVYHHNNVVAGKWRIGDFATTRTYEVEGKRLGIVGLGNIGKKVARRVQGFDMMVEEPPAQNHPLFSLPNVTLTPHSAGPTWDNWTKAYRNGFDNIQRVEAGRTPLWVVPELRSLVG